MSASSLQLRAERAPFVMLPRWLLYHADVGEGAKVLYCILHDLVAGREGPTRPVSRAQLAECCGVSVDTVDRRLTQLVAAGAVEKQAQIVAGGQAANVYQVWLTPPDGLGRPSPIGKREPSANRGRVGAAQVEGRTNGLVDRSRDPAAPGREEAAGPQLCGGDGRADAAPNREEEQEEDPPQPPRRAGGPRASLNDPDSLPGRGGRRADGTNLRSVGANPRANETIAAAERERERTARAEADAETKAAQRMATDTAAAAAMAAFEAEADALSAALDDPRLCAVVDHVRDGLPGVLAGSPLAVTRAVLTWCRTAGTAHPGPLPAAVDVSLADPRQPADDAPPLTLPPATADTVPLRRRVAAALASRREVG